MTHPACNEDQPAAPQRLPNLPHVIEEREPTSCAAEVRAPCEPKVEAGEALKRVKRIFRSGRPARLRPTTTTSRHPRRPTIAVGNKRVPHIPAALSEQPVVFTAVAALVTASALGGTDDSGEADEDREHGDHDGDAGAVGGGRPAAVHEDPRNG